MNNQFDKIELDLSYPHADYLPHYCTFNLSGEFISYSKVGKVDITTDADTRRNRDFHFKNSKLIWVYSTETKNNKWACKRIYKIPENFELISISKHDKLYLFSNDYFYVWNMDTEKSTRIYLNMENEVI
jgi:hypothetical protein